MTDHNHGETSGRGQSADRLRDRRPQGGRSGLWLAGATIGALVVGYFIYLGLSKWTISADPTPSPLAEVNRNVAPPAPNLQVQPEKELAEMKAAEHERLTTWGWVDESRGIAHMPIDLAIDRLAVPEPIEPIEPSQAVAAEAPVAPAPVIEGDSPAADPGTGH